MLRPLGRHIMLDFYYTESSTKGLCVGVDRTCCGKSISDTDSRLPNKWSRKLSILQVHFSHDTLFVVCLVGTGSKV